MKQPPSTRRKWEIAIAGTSIAVTAILGGWINGLFGNVPPFPAWYHRTKGVSRIVQINSLQESSIPKGWAYDNSDYSWNPQLLESADSRAEWEKGKITLQVNGPLSVNEKKAPGSLPVVLINDTDSDLDIPTQSGGIGLKLEARLTSGQWQRAQIHVDDFCARFHSDLSLPAHSFVKIRGYQPLSGKYGKIRFAIHNGASEMLVSEEFDGLFSSDDIALSAYDSMGLREADLNKLRNFLFRKESPKLLLGNANISMMRQEAWEAILNGRHDRDSALALAREVIKTDPLLALNSDRLEAQMEQRQWAMDQEAAKRPRIYGFIPSQKVDQNPSPSASSLPVSN